MKTKDELFSELREYVESLGILEDYQLDLTIAKGELLWQVKGMLNRQAVKLKTLDQKEENQEDQPEQGSSTHNNDQTLPEKEQRLKTRNTSKPQFVISYPAGCTIYNEQSMDNAEIAEVITELLNIGQDIIMPNSFQLQVIIRNDL